MHLIFRSCNRPDTGCASLLDALPAGIPDEPFKPLEFWHIKKHDRKALIERIGPYMVSRLPRAYLMQTVAAECRWSCRIFSPGPARTEDQGTSCWQQVVTEFWDDPSRTIEKLLLLAQAWFFTLLRHIYRMRFFARGKRCERELIVGDVDSCTESQYAVGLTNREIHRLTGIPNQYGATFYRSCYKDARECPGWERFSTSILWFCRSIQFPTHSDSPEQILKELGGNLPSVILQRRWSHIASRLNETSDLVTATADHMKRLDTEVKSEGSSNLKRMEHMEQEIGSLHAHCKRLSLACEAMVTERTKTDCMNPSNTHALNHASLSLENLVACRWLLENLPDVCGTQKGFGAQWRSFWQLQWNQYDDSVKSGKHPLRALKADERYNKVGKNLYGTLSNILHGYGHLRNVSLHPDVQAMVKIIGPVHYNKNKEIDIEAERRRWMTRMKKVTSK